MILIITVTRVNLIQKAHVFATICVDDFLCVDACVRISCENNGTCFNHLNGYVCDCLPGYVGVHCEIGE